MNWEVVFNSLVNVKEEKIDKISKLQDEKSELISYIEGFKKDY